MPGEQVAAAPDQRYLKRKVYIAKVASEMENDLPESAMKLAQAHGVSTKMIPLALHKI